MEKGDSMKTLFNKIACIKRKGNGDLIASLFVVLAISVILLLAVSILKDVENVIEIDQIARQGILLMESKGTLTTDDCTYIKEELTKRGAVEDDTLSIKYYVNGVETPLGVNAGYGNKITIRIECNLPAWVYESGGFMGIMQQSMIQHIVREKSSVAKY